ncbi:uncharacterized protein LOC104903024 isoform X2 [Beta vulgaris subsp. vulgaris]|uniref:uncharacterized protein LOC104903024 isoform X2 n=1 Tax=Beta vulgaris subsp. vulgaris TaxID=3555 RepID=UPI0025481174|nr:uncharacterized protein LOC104903024 isoform X2 [Beta vulgaris subsp. vulgaris]
MLLFSQVGPFSLKNKCCCSSASSTFKIKTLFHMDPTTSRCSRSRSCCRPFPFHLITSRARSSSLSPPRNGPVDGTLTLQEWQGWGTTSPVPATISDAIAYLKNLETETDVQMNFGGNGGRLTGEFRIEEDKKHRAAYRALSDSEMKLQFFSARQIACRLLGSRGYLCQRCWLPLEDCMCLKVKPCPLWRGIRFWLYMHPKDFLRQNNTGKLLWQVFGVQAATLCLFGIVEQEDIMWNELEKAGKNKVWCLYPNKSGVPKSAKDYFLSDMPSDEDCALSKTSGDNVLNFILIDGTWNNSGAMFKRLKDRAKLVWGEDNIACISVATGASAMHKLSAGLNHHGIAPAQQQRLLAFFLNCNLFLNFVHIVWINRLKL